MESILQWGLDFIRVVQTIASPQLTFVMRMITIIGNEITYLVLLPVIYWCVNEKKGLHLGFIILISAWINLCFKFLFDQPRPFFEGYDPSLGLISESKGGLPSGHAQNSLVLFFMLASWIKKSWAYIGAAVICLLISFSRIYLGVHFPTDIIGGWILGSIILSFYFLYSSKIEELLVKHAPRAGMIAAAFVSMIMLLYLPSKSLLMPAGMILGLGVGYCLNKRYVGFRSSAFLGRTDIKKYLTLSARLLLGFTGFFLIFFSLGKLIPQDSANVKIYIFTQIALGGFWVSVISPWIFVKLHLAGAEENQ